MTTAIAVIRLLAMSQVLFTALALVGSKNSALTRALAIGLCLGAMAYLVLPLIGDLAIEPGFLGLRLAADMVPALLLLFVWIAFEDSNPPAWAWAATLAYLGLLIAERISEAVLPLAASEFKLAAQLAKLMLVIAAALTEWRGRNVDLIELRIKFRLILSIGLVVLVFGIVFTELITGWNVPPVLELMGMTAILILALGSNLAFLRLNPQLEFGGLPRARVPSAKEDPLIQSLMECMTKGRMYANPDLRIATLASYLKVPEHRLRRTINQTLGYRNFNQYVNDYRIAEAAERLHTQAHLPVLSIALDVGFSSMSVFNEAFRARKDCAPSVWRSRKPQDS